MPGTQARTFQRSAYRCSYCTMARCSPVDRISGGEERVRFLPVSLSRAVAANCGQRACKHCRSCRRNEFLLNPTRADRFHRSAGSGPQSPHARHIEALDTRERLRLLREDGSKTTRPTIAKSWSIWAQIGRPLTRSGGLRSRWPIDWDLTIGHLQAVQEWTDAAEKTRRNQIRTDRKCVESPTKQACPWLIKPRP